MHFSRKFGYGWVVWIGLYCLSLGMVAGCKDNIAEQNDIFADAEQRVRTLVLPELNAESQAVLRNLVNVLTVFPEVCATPLAALGSFTSQTIGKPSIILDDNDGEWILSWFNVVLGDKDGTTVNPDATPVDITMTIMFRAANEAELRAVPFSLTPQTTLRTDGEPPSFAPGTTEGFFLYQDDQTGAWILRWRAVGGERSFAGTINASAGISRLIRHPDDPTKSVASLSINSVAQEVTFGETVAAGNDQGFAFYVRPGEAIQFRLRMGVSGGDLRDITTNDLRIGADDAFLPPNKAPGNFFLSSNEPIDPTGEPPLTLGTDRGTFLWQDTTTSGCAVGEDQWRLRFITTPNSSDTFSGEFAGEDEEAPVTINLAIFGQCPEPTRQQEGRAFSYTCSLGSGQIGGYDVCVSGGTRVTLEAFINSIRDPALVFVGAERSAPPSPDPFTIRFDITLEERNSARQLKFSDAELMLRGNNEESDLKLDLDQVSLEPPCVDGKRLLARMTEEGDYATNRFEGSRFILDEVEFLADDATVPQELRRFPDRGVLQLDTRVEAEEAEIKALTDTIRLQAGEIRSTTVVFVTVNKVLFTFPDESAVLTVD